MTLKPPVRKLALTAHVTFSVGWLGAVVAFLGLAVVGLTSQDAQTVRGAYLVMEPAAWFALVPLAFASLLTGVVQSLGTTWGLFRHYWVVFKFLLNIFAVVILLIYMKTFSLMAGVAADPTVDIGMVRNASPRLHAVLALLVLLVATVLAVYKPRGMTPYGRRKQREQRRNSRPMPPPADTYMPGAGLDGESSDYSESMPRWVKAFGAIFLLVVLLFLILMFTRGPGGHGHGPGTHRRSAASDNPSNALPCSVLCQLKV